jgi:hypothetical protein
MGGYSVVMVSAISQSKNDFCMENGQSIDETFPQSLILLRGFEDNHGRKPII